MSKDLRLIVIGLLSFLVLVVAIGMLYNTTKPEGEAGILGGKDRQGKMTIVSAEDVAINQPFQAQVKIDTDGVDVNAAGIYLRYDPTVLQLLNMDTSDSFCQFYPEKRYDQNLGTISLACGSPHPGVNGENTMIELEFMPVKLGTTTIKTDIKSQLLASDGKGDNNVLEIFPSKSITILNTL